MESYRELEGRFGRLLRVADAVSMLHWDHEAMMPEGAAQARSEQLSTLQVVQHEMLTDARIGELLEAARDEDLGDWERANLEEMRRRHVHAACVPASLVEAQSRESSACQMVWRRARAEDDFEALAPRLSALMEVQREVAQVKAEALGLSPYDALLDQYAPGWSSARIDELFGELTSFLPSLIDEVIEAQSSREAPRVPEGPFSKQAQRRVAVALMEQVGFDFRRGRLDESEHPFCGGGFDDVRITIDYLEQDFARSLMAVLHETGHALYEFGLPRAWAYQPVGRARGMATHESQSILLEMQVCRSRAFFEYAAPLLREAFGGEGDAWSASNLAALATRVERGLIRIDADEVTYPAHVVLRYELERQLIDGGLEVADLPAAWNQKMQELVGVRPATDREGCMQDIHWVSGAVGYFPTYTLGALSAAQLFEAAGREVEGLIEQIAGGEFKGLLGWLREHVHERASSVSSDALIEDATGAGLSAEAFRRHIERRYLGSPQG